MLLEGGIIQHDDCLLGNATQITARKARDGTKSMPNLFSKMESKKDFEQLLLDF